jgi:cobalt/nickel transport system permease protein
VSHLHLPDGALPWWLWVSGFLAAGLLLAIVSRRHRNDRSDRLALVGALSALMLAAMALPLGPLGYHLSLAPLVGMLLGGGLGFISACVVNAILALLGHGGVTVIGLNSLITGLAAALGSRTYRILAHRLRPFWAAAIAAVVGMVGSLAAWLVVVGIASATPSPREMRVTSPAHDIEDLALPQGTHGIVWQRFGRLVLFSVPFWVVGTLAEAVVAGGTVRFLARVNPSLLPAHAREPEPVPRPSPTPERA